MKLAEKILGICEAKKGAVQWDDIPSGTQRKIGALEKQIEDIKDFGSGSGKEKKEQIAKLRAQIDKLEDPYRGEK